MSVYGFEKLGERNDWCFYHNHFHRDFPDNLIYITRVKSSNEISFEAAQRRRYYQEMVSESAIENTVENTLMLLQSPNFILNALTPLKSPNYMRNHSCFPSTNNYPLQSYYKNYYYYTPVVKY